MRDYHQSINRYLVFLAAACLISLPFIGPGAVVIWLITAVALKAIAPESGNED